MTYVEHIKNNLECCISKKTAEYIKLESELIVSNKLKNEIDLLNLFTLVLSDLDCDDEIPKNIKLSISNICGSSVCTDCESNDEQIIVEEWKEDVSKYETKWIPIVECCETYIPETKWVPMIECCEVTEPETKWIPLTECCEIENPTKWIPLMECCEEGKHWISTGVECCEHDDEN